MTDAPLGLDVLAVDDEPPALDELAYLLRRHRLVRSVTTATDATGALRHLRDRDFDAVFLDIRMPGLDGLELARVLSRFAVPPPIVFVTAFDGHAVEAFELHAADYLLKPLRAERLDDALRRIMAPGPGDGSRPAGPAGSAGENRQDDDLAVIPVERGGRFTTVDRDQVLFVEAHGDYVRLHTAGAAHLVRMPISALEARWERAGFVRIHRGYLVALTQVGELLTDSTGYAVVVAGRTLPVSRRHVRQLKERLLRAARDRSHSQP